MIHKYAGRLFASLAAALAVLSLTVTQALAAAPNIVRTSATQMATNGYQAYSFTGYLNAEAFQDGIVSFNGWQYLVFWDSAGHVEVSRRQLATSSWQTMTLTDYTTTSTDSHNVVSLGIDHVDGTIHLVFDMHNNPIRYRRSITGVATNPSTYAWTPSLFGAVQTAITSADSSSLTYPQFINRPDGHLQLTLREGASGSGNQVLYEYTGAWVKLGQFVNGTAADENAYFFGFTYRAGILYVSWTWRATSGASSNHDIMYASSPDDGRTWYNSAGTEIGTTGQTAITSSSPGVTVWSIAQNRGLMNSESQMVDSKGQIHILASQLPDSAASQSDFDTARQSAVLVHYYRATDGVWHRIESSFREGVSRSQIGVDSKDNVYTVNASSLDSKLRIQSASAASGWTDWTNKYTSTAGATACDALNDKTLLANSDKLTIYYVEGAGKNIDVQDWTVNA